MLRDNLYSCKPDSLCKLKMNYVWKGGICSVDSFPKFVRICLARRSDVRLFYIGPVIPEHRSATDDSLCLLVFEHQPDFCEFRQQDLLEP